jgi:hypothetical protein
MTSYFPRFVIEEENQTLMEEVSKDELKSILASFKRDKKPRPGGWLVDLFIEFYDLLEKDLVRVVEEARITGKFLGAFQLHLYSSYSKIGLAENLS